MNVLHYGLILSQPYDITRGLREIGVNADYVLWDDCGESWLIKGWDENLNMEKINQPFKWFKQRAIMTKFMSKIIVNYDIIHFHCRPTLWYTKHLFSDYSDTRFLKSIGKKLFVSFWGCDIRNWKNDITYAWSPCNRCLPHTKLYCKTTSEKTIEAARCYCDAMFSGGDLKLEYPDVVWGNLAIDTNEISPDIKHNIPKQYVIDRNPDEILIYHSFGNSSKRPDVKGTRYIKSAISNLIKKGYKINYVFVDNVPTHDMKYIQVQADIVIDQLCSGWYGTTAVECMSLGKPVIAYLRDDILKICPNENIPIINATPKTIEHTLEYVINHKSYADFCGTSGRDYATKYHDRIAVAKAFVPYYEGA